MDYMAKALYNPTPGYAKHLAQRRGQAQVPRVIHYRKLAETGYAV
jgi:hypothetical protein